MEEDGYFSHSPLHMHFGNVGNKLNCANLYQRQSVTAEGEETLLHVMLSVCHCTSPAS